ncbi:MAG: PSD1 and planctomycete cytochrome C domain-containing protein [Ignavibacteriota bacterium]
MCGSSFAQTPDTTFFESKIRPVLVSKCYGCHASTLSAPESGLSLDTKAGVLKGGVGGPVIVPGKPEESRLLSALRYTEPDLQMPPSGKLPDAVISDFEKWIASGAPDPRTGPSTAAAGPGPRKGMSIADGRKWWAFQPIHEWPAPDVKDSAWLKTKIDSFIVAKLAEKQLKPSLEADRTVLITRAYVDLLGYKPTYDEIQAFVHDPSPRAYENLIDKLLASPHYGEQWGRHWMDVARFGEDNSTGEATNTPYPYAWRYRDWIVESINKDVPYDRFVKLQLAADLVPDATREDERALGYLGAAQVYHKDQRLSYDVIYGFLTDDWDERIDAVSRGLLGMTVACARCHDHKFDAIPTKDYYGLAGVFASSMRTERPTFHVDPAVEQRFLWMQRRLQDLRYSADLLTNEASTVVDSAPRVAKWKAEIETLHAEAEGWRDTYPQLVQHLERFWTFPPPKPVTPPAVPAATTTAGGGAGAPAPPRPRRPGPSPTEPFMHTVYDCAQVVDGSDKQYTMIVYKPGEARDLPVMMHGSVTSQGEIAPRHFLTVLSKGDSTFRQGSGRLELANDIFGDGAPLAARVIVNRVWGWHFGKPLVATPSDFGVQGEKPTHPELLDDLAARLIAHGWSLKWLNREIMLSAVYRQSSQPRADAEAIDAGNSLLWRMNPRRMDIEAFRDTLLRSAGQLSEEIGGPSTDLDSATNARRTVYGKISRTRLNNLLRQYDFPDPMQTASGRDLTTTSLQQLFLMNSPFIHTLAGTLAKSVDSETDTPAKVRALYRKILARDPSGKELDLAVTYLNGSTLDEYAQVLLSTNEEIFWR